MLAQGWTLVNTVVISTRTHKILKSAAAGNVQNKDWYIDISYQTTGAGNMVLAPFEDVASGGTSGIRGPYTNIDLSIETTYYSRFGTTPQTFESQWANTSGVGYAIPLVSSTNFVYWISVTRNRLIYTVSSQSNIAYCGFYVPTAAHQGAAGASVFPLISTALASNGSALSSTSISSVTAAVTRLPKFTDLASQVTQYGWSNSVTVGFYVGMSAGMAGQQDHPAVGGTYLAPYFVMLGSGASGIDRFGSIVGYLDGIGSMPTAVSAIRGDTVTVDGVPWYMQTRQSSTWNTIFMSGV